MLSPELAWHMHDNSCIALSSFRRYGVRVMTIVDLTLSDADESSPEVRQHVIWSGLHDTACANCLERRKTLNFNLLYGQKLRCWRAARRLRHGS